MITVLKERLEDVRKQLQEREVAKDEIQSKLQMVEEELHATKVKRSRDRGEMEIVSFQT